jgi:Na+/H+ antiporter NhaD/arsenite permease-like protein
MHLHAPLPWWSGLPFLIFVCGLALLPGIFKHRWHTLEKPFSLCMGLFALVTVFTCFGPSTASAEVFETLASEYIPFLSLIIALFMISSGVFVHIGGRPSYAHNAFFLLTGGILASLIGTTGASMLLICPFIRLNGERKHKPYLIIFFILIISNIGGSLTPVGDPPLFMGFLNGVDFTWSLKALLSPYILTLSIVLGLFILFEKIYAPHQSSILYSKRVHVKIFGKGNLVLIALLPLLLIFCEQLDTMVIVKGLMLNDMIRTLLLLALTYFSYRHTPKKIYQKNHFTSAPLKEVAMVFCVIFIALIPVIHMLKTHSGLFGNLIQFTSPLGYPDPLRYFWSTGVFSAFLDNAPTYLVFFHAAGGNADHLMGPLKPTLMAISLGSVYMGALTYIGNAPNLMVKSIAQQKGIPMPSFIHYFLISFLILLPSFLLLSYIYF